MPKSCEEALQHAGMAIGLATKYRQHIIDAEAAGSWLDVSIAGGTADQALEYGQRFERAREACQQEMGQQR